MAAEATHEDELAPEAPRVSTKRILAFVFGFLSFTAVVMIGLKLFYNWTSPEQRTVPPRPVPQPGLQINPASDLSRLLDGQHAELTRYAWIDKQAGVIRIPIERAMQILADRRNKAFDPVGVPEASPGPIKGEAQP